MKNEKTTINNKHLMYLLFFAAASFLLQSCYTWKCKREHRTHKVDTASANTRLGIYKPYNPCYNCISNECADNGCLNQFCQRAISTCHSVSPQQFIQKIQNFTGGPIPEPKIYPAWVIQGLIGSMEECEDQPIIQLCADHNVTTTNADIIIGLYPLTHTYCDQESEILKLLTPDQKKAKAKYSRAMFSGVMQLEPTEFHFYKAKSYQRDPNNCNANATLKKDIVFLALNNAGEILFYGDVSDLFP